LHWLAEVSNPFLIIRTICKLSNNTKNRWYPINDILFAVVFLIVRVVLAPFTLVYLFEGDNILFTSKVGYVFIILISFIWAFTILYNIALVVKAAFETKETKDKGQVPGPVMAFYNATNAIENHKPTRRAFIAASFIVIVVVPVGYYGFVRKNLFRNF